MADDSRSSDRTGLFPGIPHPGAVVALAAAVFAGTLLAAISAEARSELGGWWAAGMVFAILSWLAVAGAAAFGRYFTTKARVSQSGGGWLLRMICMTLVGGGFLALVGFALKLSPLGVALTALPMLIVAAYFWSRRTGVNQALGICAGAVLFLICLRLFTMGGDEDRSAPKFAGKESGDVVLLTWNVGGGAPGFSSAGENSIKGIAETVKVHGAHVVCLQEIPEKGFLEKLKVELGSGWRGQAAPGGDKATAVLSRIGGIFEASGSELGHGGPSLVRIKSDFGILNVASCHAVEGRDSAARRQIVDWVLNRARSPQSKTVIAGDFAIDPGRGWSFLRPLLTDAPRFDKATWRALNVLGSDPGFGGAPTSSLGRRTDWVVVDAKLPVTDYKVLESARGPGMDHSPVLVRIGLGKAGRAPAEESAIGAPRETMLDKAL